MAAQPMMASDHETTVLITVVGGCFAVISALVGVLYNRLNKDAEGKQQQLDDGAHTFINLRERMVALESKCGACVGMDEKDAAEIVRISAELRKLHDDVLRLVDRTATGTVRPASELP